MEKWVVRVTNMGRGHFVKKGKDPPLLLLCNKGDPLDAPHRGGIIWGEYRNPNLIALNRMLYGCIDILPFLLLMHI
jgi:hypothetical protein